MSHEHKPSYAKGPAHTAEDLTEYCACGAHRSILSKRWQHEARKQGFRPNHITTRGTWNEPIARGICRLFTAGSLTFNVTHCNRRVERGQCSGWTTDPDAVTCRDCIDNMRGK